MPKKIRRHPTQKPTKIIKEDMQVIGTNAVVLDPFCGSGVKLVYLEHSLGIDLVKYWSSTFEPIYTYKEGKEEILFSDYEIYFYFKKQIKDKITKKKIDVSQTRLVWKTRFFFIFLS